MVEQLGLEPRSGLLPFGLTARRNLSCPAFYGDLSSPSRSEGFASRAFAQARLARRFRSLGHSRRSAQRGVRDVSQPDLRIDFDQL